MRTAGALVLASSLLLLALPALAEGVTAQAKPADRTIRTAAVSKAEKAIVIGALPKVRRQKNVLPSANRGRGSGVAAVQSF